MGAIRTSANATFDDFVTSGVPASGVKAPVKSDIRATFGVVEDRIDAIEGVAATGVKWTPNIIRVRSTANVDISTALENGDTLNGVTLATGDHVFLGSQSTAAHNGIYTVPASGAASRATFADTAAELAYIGFLVSEGSVGAGERWTLPLASSAITVNTTALNFAKVGVEVDYATEVADARGGEATLDDRLDGIESVTDAVALPLTTVEWSALTVAHACADPVSPPTRSDDFTGWAAVWDKPATANWQAVRLRFLNRSPSATKKWRKIKIVAQTHATSPFGGSGTLLGVGETLVDPDVVPLSDVVILWRNPSNRTALKTLVHGDMLAKIGIGWRAFDENGDPAASSEIVGTVTGLTQTATYAIGASGNEETTGWTVASALDIGIELLTLTSPVETTPIKPRETWSDLAVPAVNESPDVQRAHRLYGARLSRFRKFDLERYLSTTSRYGLALVGDSWSAVPYRYRERLCALMRARYGHGGVGACVLGFRTALAADDNNAPADASYTYYKTYTGTGWTSNFITNASATPLTDLRSSTAGDGITLSSNINHVHPGFTGAVLHYEGTANGVIKWRWNGGAWSANTNVQTSGVNFVSLTGWPTAALAAPANTSYAAYTLEIQVVSGSVIFYLVDLQSSADGIVIHGLGASGSRVSDWLAADATKWKTSFTNLAAIKGAQVLFATNEQSQGLAPSVFEDNLVLMGGRIREAVPGIDLLFATPPENQSGRAIKMPAYAMAARAATARISAAAIDLQPVFGRADDPGEYALAADFPKMEDADHPNEATGGPLLAHELDLMWRLG